MSDGLPEGFSIKADDETPALPQGFVVKDTPQPAEPIAQLEAPEVESEGGGFGTSILTGVAKSTIAQGVNAIFGKDSEVGKLSEEDQRAWIANETTSQIEAHEKALVDVEHLKDVKRDRTLKASDDIQWQSKISANRRLKSSKARLKKVDEVLSGQIDAPEYGPIKNALAGAPKAFLNAFGESLPKSIGAIQSSVTGQEPADTAAYKFGEGFKDFTDEILHTDAARAATTTQQVAEGLGQAGSFIVPGGAAKALGAGGKTQTGVMMTTGMAQGGAQGLDDAIKLNADREKQLQSFYLNFGLGATEAIPLSRMFGRLNRASGGRVEAILKNSGQQGFEEAIQEMGQTLGSNFIAKELAAYDEGRELLKDVGQGGKVGFIVGALLGGGGTAIATRGQTGASESETQDAPLPEGFEVIPEGNVDREPTAAIPMRTIKPAVAYDAAGGQTKVEYAIVDVDSLITSHGDDMQPNPSYPQALQPRDRSRKSSETQVTKMAGSLNPEQLGETPDAGSGSPIISVNGIVESGNGRTMSLRRVYQENGAKAQEYRDWLKKNKYNTKGIKNPVLVRIADPSRSDQERVDFTRRANAAVTADMSVTERGIADARSLSPQDFDLAKAGGAELTANIPFVRQVLTKVTSEAERGKLIDSKGRLSVDGKRRVEAAVASYAYEDPRILSTLIETTDKTLRSIGDVMIDVAPQWAQLRADIEAGRVDERTNIIPNIIEAANIITDARSTGATVDERIAAIKSDMFNEGGEIDPVTQDILKLFYDEKTLKQRKPKAIAEDLAYYTQEASKVLAGPDIFGDRSADNPAQRILAAIQGRNASTEQKTVDEDFTASQPQEEVFLPEGFEIIDEPQTDDKTAPLFNKKKGFTEKQLRAFQKKLEKDLNLRSLSLSGRKDEINIGMIAVQKGELGKGTGSKAMERITEFADKKGARITLTTGVKDDGFGTTSATRLKRFYKRFGFVENKGRNKDFSISGNMYREPQRIKTDAPLFDKAPKTESAAFKRWFGDSKVVDENGAPLVVYHGTAGDIEAFDPSLNGQTTRATSTDGFWFSSDSVVAQGYARYAAEDVAVQKVMDKANEAEKRGDWDAHDKFMEQAEKLEVDIRKGKAGDGANIVPVYLAMNNPLEIDAKNENPEGIGGISPLVQRAKRQGRDGLIIRNFDDTVGRYDHNRDHFMVFEPSQIKSVNNRGTFDRNDDRILYDKALEVTELPDGFTLLDDVGPVEPKPKQMTRGRQKRRAVATPEGQKVGHDGETKGLHDITNAIRKRFGAIARQGRMGNLPQSVRGFFKPKTGVIRTRQSYLAEIDTFAHEVGHHFEYMNDDSLRKIMEIHRSELGPMDYDPNRKDKEVQLSEGFAEFFTAYITNPAYARAQAPKFAKRFDAWLDKNHAGLRPQIQEFSRQYNDYLTAPSATSIASNIVQHPKTGIKKTIQKAKDQGKSDFAGTVLNQGIERIIDRTNPMKLVVNELKKIYRENTGRSLDLKAVDDPYKIIRLSMNASSTGVMDMMQGVAPYKSIEHEGPSLRDAVEKAIGNKKSWNAKNTTDFDAYLIARRAVQEYKRYLSGEISNPPTINSLADHKQAIKDYEKSNPQFKDAAKMIYEYQANLWKKRLDAGLITQELYDITTERQDYVPFRRDMSDQGSIKKLMNGVSKNTKFAGGAKHFDGSSRPILSPLQSIMEDTIKSAQVIAQNDSLKALVSLAHKAGKNSSAVVEVIPRTELKGTQVDVIDALTNRLKNTSFTEEDQAALVQEISQALDEDGLTTIFKSVEASEKGENIVYVWNDGVRQPVLVGNPELAMDVHSMMLGLNDEASNTFVNIMAVPTTVLRMGITNHPMFIATNFIRDQLTTWVQSDAGFMPFVDGFRGVVAELTNNKYAKAYNTMGGVSGGVNVSAFKKGAIDKDLNQMRSRGIQVRRLWRLSEMSKLGDISESATRLGLFTKFVKKFKKEGMTDHEAFFEAAFEATDVMDFSMHGGQMNAPRRLIPFLNAQIVGLYKTGRTLAPGGVFATVKPYIDYRMTGENKSNLSKEEIRKIEMGAKAWAKVAAIGMIGLSLSAMHDDDEEYLEFNEYYRSTHWITKIGGEWVLIPKPFELAAMSNLFERSYEAFKLKDETAFKKFRKGMRDMLKPPMSIPAIGVPIEQIMNKTFFNKSQIVPYGTEGYAAYGQYSANTSIFARRLGKLLGWSPARIDHAIKGFGATMGRDALRISDAVSGEKPSLSPSNTPVISRLVKNPNFGAKSRSEMFDRVGQQGKWTGLSRQLKKAVEDEDTKEVKEVLSHVDNKDQAAYVISHAIYSGKRVALKRMHPMRRAADGSQILRKARKAIVTNEFEGADLTRDQRRDLSEAIIKLDVAMARNGLKYSNQKGYVQKDHTDEAPLMDKIKSISPEVHKSIKGSFAKKKITREHDIEKKYSRLKRRLAIDAKAYE